jgi:hypothetical protein
LTPDGSSIVIENSDGVEVARGTVSPDDAHVQTAELPALPGGEYMVRWTSVSADDAAVERGTYTFNVGAAASATASPVPVPIDGPGGAPSDLIALGLAAVFIGIVVVVVILRGRR